MPLVFISWPSSEAPAKCTKWILYASDREGRKGEPHGEVLGAESRGGYIELPEGTWWVHALPQTADGREAEFDWGTRTTKVVVTGMENPVPTPANAIVAAVDMQAELRAECDPPSMVEEPFLVQVIEGPDEWRGRIAYEYTIAPGSPMAPRGVRFPSPPIPVEGMAGHASTPTSRTVLMRGRNMHGLGGTAQSFVVPIFDRFACYTINVASIVGNTLSGFPSPAATTSLEVDATDGLRLAALPAGGSLHGTNDGTGAAGRIRDHSKGTVYFTDGDLESNEIDLGAVVTGVLEVYDETQRKTAVSPVWTSLAGVDVGLPAFPADSEVLRRDRLEDDKWWIARQLTGDGKPIDPLRKCGVLVAWGTSSGVTDFKPYMKGMVITARYVKVRKHHEEPTGYHQVICPKFLVTMRVPLTFTTGAGTPEGAVTGVPGSHRVRTDGAPHHYVKGSGLGNTGWLAQAGINANGAVVDTMGHAVLSKSANYTLQLADRGKLILVDASGGAVTIAMLPVATAKAGFLVGVKKIDNTANAVTVDGDGAEQVDFATTRVLAAQGEVTWLTCDGSGWKIAAEAKASATVGAHESSHEADGADPIPGLLIEDVVLSGSGTYTVPTGCTRLVVEAVGGGGGGGGAANGTAQSAAGGGGGAGGYALVDFVPVDASYPYACGAGGAGGTAGANDGTAGTDTTFDSGGGEEIVAKGGGAGKGQAAGTAAAGAEGGATAISTWAGTELAKILGSGDPGKPGFRSGGAFASSGAGGSSMLGGGAGRGRISTSTAITGTNGIGPGAGGGGAAVAGTPGAAAAGGDGIAGAIRVRAYS